MVSLWTLSRNLRKLFEIKQNTPKLYPHTRCAACFARVSGRPWEDTHPKNQNFATAKNPLITVYIELQQKLYYNPI